MSRGVTERAWLALGTLTDGRHVCREANSKSYLYRFAPPSVVRALVRAGYATVSTRKGLVVTEATESGVLAYGAWMARGMSGEYGPRGGAVESGGAEGGYECHAPVSGD